MSEQSADDTDPAWVFECTECGEQWADPPAPVTGHHCDRDPRAPGIPGGEAADVEVIQKP